jgi:tetratricopeptide (TPR) repeat protein
MLLERSLIDTVTLMSPGGITSNDTTKALVVPRPVREYVRGLIDDETARSLDAKAIELYFGAEWISGNIKSSPTGRRVRSAFCDGYEIQNAATLILRSSRRALLSGPEVDATRMVRLASAFAGSLLAGNHFRSAAALCEDMIRLLDENETFQKERNYLRYQLARCLRMIGRLPEAREAYVQLDQNMLNKRDRQAAELGLALTLEQLKDFIGAAGAAERAITIDDKSAAALHAKVVIAGQIND